MRNVLEAGLGGDMPFKYWTYGAAATEVELDVLTGSHRVLRADICMDLGQPLNPALDIGQIEGAYVQVQRCSDFLSGPLPRNPLSASTFQPLPCLGCGLLLHAHICMNLV